MEQPGAFARFGCAGRCCVKGEQACAQGALLEMLREQNPLKVAKGVLINENLTSRTTFSDLITMVIRQLEWGTSTPVAYRRSAIMPLLEREGSNLSKRDMVSLAILWLMVALVIDRMRCARPWNRDRTRFIWYLSGSSTIFARSSCRVFVANRAMTQSGSVPERLAQ